MLSGAQAQTVCAKPIIPDVITPNNDGFNDVLLITCIEAFPENHFTVFNRWGQIVYEAFNYDNNWSGTYNIDKGPLPDGTYIYIFVTPVNGIDQSFHGTITIVR